MRKPKLKLSKGAGLARAKFEEAKHKRDIGGKFADKPGAGNDAPKGGQGPAKSTADWQASAKTTAVTGTDQIKVHAPSNPKKPGSASAARFDKYEDGITVDRFIKAGGTREDLAWDRKRGYISIHEPADYQKLSGVSPVAEINPNASGRLGAIKSGKEPEPSKAKPAVPKSREDFDKEKEIAAKEKEKAAKEKETAAKAAAPKKEEPAAAPKKEEPATAKPADTPDTVATFKKGDTLDNPTLHGVEMKPWTPPKDSRGWQKVEGQMDNLVEPPMTAPGKIGSGVLVTEPDGRVWVVKPTNAFGGYRHTFPKGTLDKGEGLSLQANAIKETYEESGLKVKITGYAGDFKGDTGTTRYYHATRTGGTPLDHGWESEAVMLVPKKQLDGLLNKQRDKDIMSKHITGDPAEATPKMALPGGTAQAGGLPKPMPNNHRFKADELMDMPASRMADEAEKGLKWEYEVEYIKYGGKNWGPGIKDLDDFTARYKEAPLTYLTDSQYDNLGYTSVNTKKLPTFDEVHAQIGHRRNPAAIRERIFNGVTTPPIVLKKGDSLRLMAGQSRIFTGLATGVRIPVKIIDVSPGVVPPVQLYPPVPPPSTPVGTAAPKPKVT